MHGVKGARLKGARLKGARLERPHGGALVVISTDLSLNASLGRPGGGTSSGGSENAVSEVSEVSEVPLAW